MATESALLFRENQMQMMTPILPADQNMAGVAFKENLTSMFGQKSDNRPVAPAVALSENAGVKIGMSASEKNLVADNANLVGDSLRNPAQGMRAEAPKGEIGYAGSAVAKLGMEAVTAFTDLFKDKSEPAVEPEHEVQAPRPAMAAGGMPSPSSGMGG